MKLTANLMVANYIINNLTKNKKERISSLKKMVDFIELEIQELARVEFNKKSKVKAKVKRGRPKKINTQFMKKLTPSPELAKFLGSPSPVQRAVVVNKIWHYIKKNNLQKPTNKRNIMVDDILKPILLKNEVTMFELAGLIGRNLK